MWAKGTYGQRSVDENDLPERPWNWISTPGRQQPSLPGKQDMSILATIVLGIVGSFVGGFLGYLLFHKDGRDGFLQPAGIIGSFIGAVIVLLIWIQIGKRRSVRR